MGRPIRSGVTLLPTRHFRPIAHPSLPARPAISFLWTPDQVGRDGSGIASGVMVEVLRVGVMLLLILVIASHRLLSLPVIVPAVIAGHRPIVIIGHRHDFIASHRLPSLPA